MMTNGTVLRKIMVFFLCIGAMSLYADETAAFKAFRETIEDYLRRQAAAVNQDLAATRELNERQQADVTAMITAIRSMQEKVVATEAKMTALLRENVELKAEVARLGEAIDNERAARIAADRQIVAEVTRAVSDASRVPAPGQGGPAPATGRRYQVARGDTLGAIAKAFGTSVAAIKRANGLENDMIRQGQELIIPEE